MRKRIAEDYVVITIGIVTIAAAVYFFMLPLSIVTGSISGLALILSQVTGLAVSTVLMVLNVVCLLLGFLLLGREFGAKTTYVSVVMPLLLRIFETVFPMQKSPTGDVILDIVCLIIVASIGQTLLFRANASSGGLDVIGKIMNKYLHMELGNALALAGIVTVLCAVPVYDSKTIIVGLLGTYFNGLVVDAYISGFSRKKKVCVISQRQKEIREYILTEIKRGVTLYPVQGGYTSEEKTELVTILNKNEYAQLMNFLKTVDECAFVSVSTVSEIAGLWNKHGKTTVV